MALSKAQIEVLEDKIGKIAGPKLFVAILEDWEREATDIQMLVIRWLVEGLRVVEIRRELAVSERHGRAGSAKGPTIVTVRELVEALSEAQASRVPLATIEVLLIPDLLRNRFDGYPASSSEHKIDLRPNEEVKKKLAAYLELGADVQIYVSPKFQLNIKEWLEDHEVPHTSIAYERLTKRPDVYLYSHLRMGVATLPKGPK
jgi:hypothetical protein